MSSEINTRAAAVQAHHAVDVGRLAGLLGVIAACSGGYARGQLESVRKVLVRRLLLADPAGPVHRDAVPNQDLFEPASEGFGVAESARGVSRTPKDARWAATRAVHAVRSSAI